MLLRERYNIDDIIITNHARQRFEERYSRLKNLQKVYDADYKIRNIMKYAEKVEIDSKINTQRILKSLDNLKSGAEKPDYYYNAGWRLVIINGVLVTIERIKADEN